MRSASPAIHWIGDLEMGWDDVTSNFNLSIWASSKKFYVGDTIVFGYDHEKHNVISACESDYAEGRTNMYYYHSDEFDDDGHTIMILDETGPWYFMCGLCSDHKFTIQVEPHPEDKTEETEDNKS